MAILNITPDSFSDGGACFDTPSALAAAERMLAEGADMLDVGGESTRPGAAPVSVTEQIRRTAPVIRAIRARFGGEFPISIDTTRAEVARAALDAGADAVNDTSGGRDDPGMFELVAQRGAGLILMHRFVAPSRDAYSTHYTPAARPEPVYPGGVVHDVRRFLAERTVDAERAGVPPARIMIDPGLGFGKSIQDNLRLIHGSAELASLGYPVLSGLSRKSFVGRLSGLSPDRPARDRLDGTIALSVLHYLRGARMFRVHDVAAHVAALNAIHHASLA